MADVPEFKSDVATVPDDYRLSSGPDFLLKTVTANINGSAAAGAYLPALQVLTPSGAVAWTAVPDVAVPAGASVLVSWFRGVGEGDQGGASSAGGSIDSITSPTSSIAVGAPTGPSTTVDLPPSGVVAGTYGDGAHVAEVQVNSDGIVTSASSVAIGGSSFVTVLFDSTLGGSAAAIDTGAGGVAGGFSALMILVIGRGDAAVFSASFSLQFNNDTTAANYDIIWTNNSNGVSSSFISTATGAAKTMEGPGASIGAGVFGVSNVFIPGYAQTTAHKAATALGGFAETSGHSELVHATNHWASTAAITRVKLFTGAGNLVAGSRMTIYGLP